MIFFLIFAQNIDCGYMLEPHRRGDSNVSTHNLCLGAKIRKKVYPCILQFCYIKVGYKGVYISRTCFPDVSWIFHFVKKTSLLLLLYCFVFKKVFEIELEIITWAFWLSPAVSTRDSIIKPESFSSRTDNGRGLIQRAMTKIPCYNLFITSCLNPLFQRFVFRNVKNVYFCVEKENGTINTM